MWHRGATRRTPRAPEVDDHHVVGKVLSAELAAAELVDLEGEVLDLLRGERGGESEESHAEQAAMNEHGSDLAREQVSAVRHFTRIS